ncbi:MAG TPA: NfeD family protein [Candidatus Acidoferrales bacterium]|nr:NfeD family protein [Candidatus Acidoferrales bacterium]
MGAKARLAFFGAAFLVGFAGLAAGVAAPVNASREVLVVPIDGTVDAGMAHLVDRAIDDANRTRPAAVVLEINTPGGLVDAAFEIRDALLRAQVPTVAFVAQRAYSAGALITISAQKIIMAPGSSLGAAEPIPKTVKTVSALRAEFASTAARNHRNPVLAAAMVDANVNLPAYKAPGAILTLTADEALRAHYADAIAPTLPDALRVAHLDGLPLRTEQYTFGEQLARFASSPDVSGILLTIGVLGLIIELQTLNGLAGLVGVGALALFFGAHVYAGFSNGFVVVLAVFGVLAILFELHVVPGHGISGIIGALALLAAVFFAFGGLAFSYAAAQAMAIALVLSVIAIVFALRAFPQSAFMRRFVFSSAQGSDYVASTSYTQFLGHTGEAASLLRPAGVATVDGERLNVLTEGEFVAAGTPLRVTRVEGARIFVRPLSSER